MPVLDKNGNSIQVGSIVYISAQVTHLRPQEKNNLALKFVIDGTTHMIPCPSSEVLVEGSLLPIVEPAKEKISEQEEKITLLPNIIIHHVPEVSSEIFTHDSNSKEKEKIALKESGQSELKPLTFAEKIAALKEK